VECALLSTNPFAQFGISSETADTTACPSGGVHVECAKFFGDHLACRNENKISNSFIAFVS
jgi:hypothetical protein